MRSLWVGEPPWLVWVRPACGGAPGACQGGHCSLVCWREPPAGGTCSPRGEPKSRLICVACHPGHCRGLCLKIIFVLAPGFLRTIFSQCLCCDYQAVSSMDAKSSITSGDESESNVSSLGQRLQVGMIVPTDSEEEQQGARTNGDHLKSLPRSLRWRIQLGILHDPIASTNFAKNAKESICNLNSILSHNEDEISRQAERFKNLVEKYTEETSEVDNEHPDLSPSMPSDKFEFDSTSNSAEVDPLTAMVMEKEAQETRKAELYLKYRKERARMKRGLATEARVIESESDEVDRASVSGYNVYC